MKRFYPIVFFLILALIFSWKFFMQGQLPIAADTIVGLYHPYRDFYSEDYPNGIPYKNFLITDPVRQQYPWRWLSWESFKEGVLPVWNPYSFSGTPLAANYQSGSYYPLNILFLVFPFETAWSLLVIIQPFLAGWFMYLFLTRICHTKTAQYIGAITFAFSSIMISWFTWNTLIHTILWLPLMLYSVENLIDFSIQGKRNKILLYGLLLYLSTLLLLLAGHAQVALYSLLIFAGYTVYRIAISKKTRTLFVAISIPLLFACITVLPLLLEVINFILLSNRVVDSGNINQEGWFIPLKHFIQFIAPDFFGNPATLNYWGVWNYGELTGYVGIVSLTFGIFGMLFSRNTYKKIFIVMLLIAVVFVVKNPISELPFRFSIPFLSTSQPTRLLFIITFCFSVLAGIGIDEFITNSEKRFRLLYVAAGLSLTLILLWISVLEKANISQLNDFLINIAVAKRNLYLPSLLMTITMVCYSIIIFNKKRTKNYMRVFFLFLGMLVILDLFRFGWKFTPFTSKEYLYPSTQTIQYLNSQPGLFRIMATDSRILPPNFSIMHKLQTIDGYDPLYLQNYAEFASAIIRNKPDISPLQFNRIITIQNPDHKLVDLMNVKYILSLSDLHMPHLKKVYEEGQTKVYENTRAFPRAFLVNNIKIVDTKQNAVNVLYDSSIDLHKTAVTYDALDISSNDISAGESVEVVSYKNSEVVLNATVDAPRLLILTDVYYPKWKAEVDGSEVPIHIVDYAFRGVVVPVGTHQIRFNYHL